MNFKTCTNCGHVWHTRDDFLNDKSVSVVGYQANFKELQAGIFLFNHSCKGTLALKVESFADMYKGPVFEKRATDTDDCSGYCQHQEILDACPVQCECAFVREIIQMLKK